MSKFSDRISKLTEAQKKILASKLYNHSSFSELTSGMDLSSKAEGNNTASLNENRHGVSSEKKLKKMSFSLMFFPDGLKESVSSYYANVISLSKFADKNNFEAIWIPERHCQPFGGMYPNPAIICSHIGAVTEQIQLRSGSVIAPLYNAIEIAENWSMLDNLTNGRVGLGCGSGWHPIDFITNKDAYENRRDILFEMIPQIQNLWSGKNLDTKDIFNNQISIKLYPEPVQKNLPIWIAISGNPDTWITAGKLGVNVLTGLSTQSIDELKNRISLYKTISKEYNHDIIQQKISIVLHTYITNDSEEIESLVKPSMIKYLNNFIDQQTIYTDESVKQFIERLSKDDQKDIIEHAFKQYYVNRSLIGSPDKCLSLIKILSDIGVDEIICLVDFGLDFNKINNSINILNEIKNML